MCKAKVAGEKGAKRRRLRVNRRDNKDSPTLLNLIFSHSNVFEVTLSKSAIKSAGALGSGSQLLKYTVLVLFSLLIRVL